MPRYRHSRSSSEFESNWLAVGIMAFALLGALSPALAAEPATKKTSTASISAQKLESKVNEKPASAFTVQEFFTGSFVFGVTGIWGPATDRDYQGVVVPGSEQSEVTLVSTSEVESDLVLGYVHYLEDQGAAGCQGTQCLSPVFGLGVYSWRTEEIFKSLIMGVNYQFNRHVSVAAIFALRRVNALRDGFKLGMAGEGDFSDERFRLGWGFMINFSPDILKSGFKATRTLDFSSVSEKLAE